MNKIDLITASALSKLIEEGKVILIDVREPIEYHTGHIESALNLPLSTLKTQQLDTLNDKKKKFVIYCKSGHRSTKACEKLIKNTSYDLWNLDGGISSWTNNSLPISRHSKRLSLDRQVHIALGTMILLGLCLEYYVSGKWIGLPIIIGLGLLNSGITGWCGLGKLIAKMPWNKIH